MAKYGIDPHPSDCFLISTNCSAVKQRPQFQEYKYTLLYFCKNQLNLDRASSETIFFRTLRKIKKAVVAAVMSEIGSA